MGLLHIFYVYQYLTMSLLDWNYYYHIFIEEMEGTNG